MKQMLAVLIGCSLLMAAVPSQAEMNRLPQEQEMDGFPRLFFPDLCKGAGAILEPGWFNKPWYCYFLP
ncbi:MAG: hypothetical protein FD189_2599 [Elusimicrobia bacterium]|nr:MAG: hypothetical protein FD189_2599 [Elusimicrobiota bacterium]